MNKTPFTLKSIGYKMKSRNYVAKHARQFNKSTVQVDRKKSSKKGYEKHKKVLDNS